MMNDIFADLVAEGRVCVYLDDILIFTVDLAEHQQTMEEVLQCLREHKLFLKPEKCKFECQKIEYLGLIISEGRIEMDPVKVSRVAEWPRPNSKKEVQQFVGFVNFYWHFIKDYSTIARPLFDLIGNIDFRWGEEQEKAFLELKQRVTSALILVLLDDSKPFQLEVDSSNVATRAVLSQQSESDGKWHPIAFYSKALSTVKQNYNIYDKEMLAIVHALEEWQQARYAVMKGRPWRWQWRQLQCNATKTRIVHGLHLRRNDCGRSREGYNYGDPKAEYGVEIGGLHHGDGEQIKGYQGQLHMQHGMEITGWDPILSFQNLCSR